MRRRFGELLCVFATTVFLTPFVSDEDEPSQAVDVKFTLDVPQAGQSSAIYGPYLVSLCATVPWCL